MPAYTPTIGLEIHAELKTKTKMFCSCLNAPDERMPNIHVCAVCLAHPGTLPVINKEAVKAVLMVGTALGGRIADFSEFDRKNYFYPDIPKGYQISQYKYPLVEGGALAGVAITRVHLEEDTARNQHAEDKSLVDYNRAGVPLMELVTEPCIHDAETAGAFARELQLLLRTLGAGDANMEKGELRIEANVSVAPATETNKEGGLRLGTKVEVKNLNSFRSVERAIRFEIERQSKLLDEGGKVVQETRGWDEVGQKTYTQRKKESSHDYRYFPDPDLPKLALSEVEEFGNLPLPELPTKKRERLQALGFLQAQDIEQLVSDEELVQLFDRAAQELAAPELVKIAANFILNDIAGQRKKDPTWLPAVDLLVAVVKKYHDGALASPQAKSSILSGSVTEVADANVLPELVRKIINDNPKVAADYKAGKEAAMQFLVGQGMKESRGSANPQALQEAIQKLLA